ncbi:hypothetical protein GCM10023213_30010 [Prosthecobacter algae]|uniref:Polymer-forming cytoskeletal protein n=2 Tax=Prosthecobacter algae TaxID=1144682 RepID=A0ABP9P9Q8_9BACT
MHLSIHRKKVAASSVTRSGMGMPDPWADAAPKPAPAPAAPPAPEAEALEPAADSVAAEMAQPVSEEEAAEGGFGVFLKQQASPAPAHIPSVPPVSTPVAAESAIPPFRPEPEVREEPSVAKRPQSFSPPPTPAPALMSASTLQKMKNEGMYRNQYFKDADCFDCGHKFKVSRSTRSTQCPNCGGTISLEDVEVNMHSGQSIKTRGDVLIRKRGQVSAETIQCKDLRCQGILEANVMATGDVIIRASGTMIGEVRCRRFIVEKGSDVVFLNEIHAEEIDIQSRITATLFSSGPFVIGTQGSVNGDLTARSVSIEPGGELNGAMNIVRTKAATPPPPPITEE